MKVRYDLTASIIRDVKLEDFKQATDLQEAVEQELAELQDSFEAQCALIEESSLVQVTATKLVVS